MSDSARPRSAAPVTPPRGSRMPVRLGQQQARHIWMRAQGLTDAAPFGTGPEAVTRAVTQLGYVQIDTINVIERCHHHILYTRIPTYQRADLAHAQSHAKSLFEYWTHALSYVPVSAMRYFTAEMRGHRKDPDKWSAGVSQSALRRVMRRIRDEGPLAISDFNSDRLVEKTHLWASKKPSKGALERGFYNGQLAIAARSGMLKSYELMERHFGWDRLPKPATERQKLDYLLDRALTAQGLVSLESICHLNAPRKAAIAELIARRVKAKRLRPVEIDGCEDIQHWIAPDGLDNVPSPAPDLVHILSPFDPLVIQRKRTAALFDYQHLFEAYLPASKRQWGYFALPVLVGDRIVAAIDLKTDRQNRKLLIQNWVWMEGADPARDKLLIEAALDRFEKFQLAGVTELNGT